MMKKLITNQDKPKTKRKRNRVSKTVAPRYTPGLPLGRISYHVSPPPLPYSSLPKTAAQSTSYGVPPTTLLKLPLPYLTTSSASSSPFTLYPSPSRLSHLESSAASFSPPPPPPPLLQQQLIHSSPLLNPPLFKAPCPTQYYITPHQLRQSQI